MDRRPPGLRIYRSNRLERLAAALAERLAVPTGDAFAPECILVPGRGVAQWLGFELASSFGIWANVLYLYPRNFVAWALERVLGKPLEELQAFDPDRLLWSVCATLPSLFEHPEFEAIQRYVSGDARDVRFFELCRRIASTFDRYAAYRPDLLANWERKPRAGADNEPAPQLALFTATDSVGGWQPVLWRALLERSGSVPAGSLERSFLRNLRQASRVENLPARISCFGVTHLPPTYSRILVALGAHVPVDVFQLSASESAAVRTTEAPLKASLSRAGTPTARNPLLSSLGTLASDFESVLADELARQGVPNEAHALYETPVGPSRLSRLQRQILSDQRPAPKGRERDAASSAEDDDSICIHVCHSPMREVEVLYDQLLALLSSGAGYEPRDIVVLTPDIETYAPLIEAVFRRALDDTGRIPYTIADRTLEASAPVATALDRLLGLAGQRLSTSQVLDLLALEVIASRFEIGARDHEQITEWLTQTNVRWGVDAEHRQAHGHPASDANTWQLGLRRLFLGYAMSNDPPALVSGVLPESGATGTEAATLGKLAAFLTTLFAHVALIGTPRPMQAWPEVIAAALEALVTSDADNAWQHAELRDCLATLARRAEGAGYRNPISSTALRDLLFDLAEQARPARGFLMGGITFCSMVPLRSLPFRAVCLLGLGDGQFPRKELSADFDLMVHGGEGRRIGDRSRRSEDRYIFLEAILAARERLLITYTGQSIRDNSVLPPSVVVSELSDYLQASEPAAEPGAKTQPSYVVRHPLQAFSPRYFDGSDPRLFSYASHPLDAPSTAGLQPNVEFFSGPLPTLPDTEPVALHDLVRFYQNPTAYLLNRRLELFLREQHQDLGDREPQELAPLDKFSAGQDLLELLRRGVAPTEALELLRATSALPLGSPGELDFRELAAAATRIAALERETRQGARQPPRSVRAALPGGRHLFGVLPEAYDNGLCEPQFARVRARHLLRTWILHLTYCWLGSDGTPTAPGQLRAANQSQSSLIGRSLAGSGAVLHQFAAVRGPAQHLERLVLRYQEGLREPLRLFPSTSHAFAAWQRKPTKKDDLQGVLEKEWQQEAAHDAHLERVYGARRPFSELRRATGNGFDALALEVFEPLLEHLTSSEHDT